MWRGADSRQASGATWRCPHCMQTNSEYAQTCARCGQTPNRNPQTQQPPPPQQPFYEPQKPQQQPFYEPQKPQQQPFYEPQKPQQHPEDGLFISATETQRKLLLNCGATSLRQLFIIISTDSDYRAQRPIHAPPGAVLKTVLFAWCRNEGRGVHLCLDEAVDAGYVVEGGAFPHEWVCCVAEWPPKPGASPAGGAPIMPPPNDARSFPALGQSLDDPSAFPALGQKAPPPPSFAPAPAAPPNPALVGANSSKSDVQIPSVDRASSVPVPVPASATAGRSLSSSLSGGTTSTSLWGGVGLGGASQGLPQIGSLALHSLGGVGGLGGPNMPMDAPEQIASLWNAPPTAGSAAAWNTGSPWSMGQLPVPPQAAPSQDAITSGSGGLVAGGGGGGESGSGWAAIVKKPAAAKLPSYEKQVDSATSVDEQFNFSHELSPGCILVASKGEVFVQLHQTCILKFRPGGKLILNTGGWRTYSTLKAMNSALELVEPSTKLVADGHLTHGSWRLVQEGGSSTEFRDEMVVNASLPRDVFSQLSKPNTNARSVPPGDYVCKLCGIPGHWLDNCPRKGEPKPPPPGYSCRLCNRPGHWIRDCPTIKKVPDPPARTDNAHANIVNAAHISVGNPNTAHVMNVGSARAMKRNTSEESGALPGDETAAAKVAMLQEMSGEGRERCIAALSTCDDDVNRAAEHLLSFSPLSAPKRATNNPFLSESALPRSLQNLQPPSVDIAGLLSSSASELPLPQPPNLSQAPLPTGNPLLSLPSGVAGSSAEGNGGLPGLFAIWGGEQPPAPIGSGSFAPAAALDVDQYDSAMNRLPFN